MDRQIILKVKWNDLTLCDKNGLSLDYSGCCVTYREGESADVTKTNKCRYLWQFWGPWLYKIYHHFLGNVLKIKIIDWFVLSLPPNLSSLDQGMSFALSSFATKVVFGLFMICLLKVVAGRKLSCAYLSYLWSVGDSRFSHYDSRPLCQIIKKVTRSWWSSPFIHGSSGGGVSWCFEDWGGWCG